MKKTILFAAALLLTVAANATVWNISPTNNPESPRTDCNLYVVLDRVAGAGDTILLADGVYDTFMSIGRDHTYAGKPSGF